MRPATAAWPVRRLRDGTLRSPEEDTLAAEEPLEIRLNSRSLVVTMRTPGQDDELATGFCVNEGILRREAKPTVAVVRNPLDASHDNIVSVRAAPEDILRHPDARSFHASSACGVCGQSSLEDMERSFAPVESSLRSDSRTLLKLPDAMRAGQEVFGRTGGLHAAALFSAEGKLLALREDIGRHNAVDKVTGSALARGALPLSDHLLCVSGRAGYEVVQKAVASGIPLVAAVGAPSSLAAQLAEQAGVTLVGFLRRDSFNVYTHAQRVVA